MIYKKYNVSPYWVYPRTSQKISNTQLAIPITKHPKPLLPCFNRLSTTLKRSSSMLYLFQISQNRLRSTAATIKVVRVTQATPIKLYISKLGAYLRKKIGFVLSNWWNFQWFELRIAQIPISFTQHRSYLGIYCS